jgi:hypothetical protein
MAEKPIKIFDTLEGRYPEAEDPDVIHGAVRVALSAMPVLGSPINEPELPCPMLKDNILRDTGRR